METILKPDKDLNVNLKLTIRLIETLREACDWLESEQKANTILSEAKKRIVENNEKLLIDFRDMKAKLKNNEKDRKQWKECCEIQKNKIDLQVEEIKRLKFSLERRECCGRREIDCDCDPTGISSMC